MSSRTAYATGGALVALLASIGTAAASPAIVITVDGTLSATIPPAAVDKVVQRAAGKLRACFEKARTWTYLSEPVTFTIATTGKVQGARTLFDAPIDKCVVTTLSRLAFQPPRGGKAIELTYIVSYTPAESGPAHALLLGEGDYGYRAPEASLADEPVSIGLPEVTGGLDIATVRRHVKRQRRRLQWCFEKDPSRKRTPARTAIATFAIDPKGVVAKATATGLDDAALETCVAEVIKNIEFPAPGKREARVRLAITFDLAVLPTPAE